jgi:hypothetical protein
MTIISIHAPRHVAAPRGAAFAAWAFQAIRKIISRLSATRQERAEHRGYAARVGDAASARRYAQQVMQYDARFAADLFAAADRHEHFGR